MRSKWILGVVLVYDMVVTTHVFLCGSLPKTNAATQSTPSMHQSSAVGQEEDKEIDMEEETTPEAHQPPVVPANDESQASGTMPSLSQSAEVGQSDPSREKSSYVTPSPANTR